MANPVKFPGSNLILRAPKGTEGYIQDMHVFTNGRVCVSCWELNRDDMIDMLRTTLAEGNTEQLKIYVSVFSGESQPPIFVGSEDQVRGVVADHGGVWKK